MNKTMQKMKKYQTPLTEEIMLLSGALMLDGSPGVHDDLEGDAPARGTRSGGTSITPAEISYEVVE